MPLLLRQGHFYYVFVMVRWRVKGGVSLDALGGVTFEVEPVPTAPALTEPVRF